MCYEHLSVEKHKEKVSIKWLIKRHICLNLSSSLTLSTSLMESLFCGPCIFAHALPLNGETRFFMYFVKLWFFEKKTLPLIFVLFFKGKKTRKKNSKCDSWRKNMFMKNRVGSRGQVTYWEGTVKRPKSPSPKSLKTSLY